MKGINRPDMEPLTDEERAFSGDMENYNQFFKYMKIKKLDYEEWYDILVLHYLRAVKKYLNIPHLQQYNFGAVLFKTLDSARANYLRSMATQKRMPDGGLVSLDYVMEDDNGMEHRIEPWWIDPMQNVERYVVEKEFLRDIYSNIYRYAEPDLLKLIIDMRQEGYSDSEIARKAIVILPDYSDWGVREVVQLIKLFTRCSNGALQRLYSDTLCFGNIDQYLEWEDIQRGW